MNRDRPTVVIISGAMGTSGEQLVRTVLAQFRRAVPVNLVPHVRTRAGLERVVEQAAKAGVIIVHTLVDANLRSELIRITQERAIPQVDLVGPLLELLTAALGEQPAGQPGLYRRQREAYFERIAAIEFSVAHDDGQRIEDLSQADIVLVGVSRSGKTPLGMYLSVMGWKVANVPLIRELPPPPALMEIDRRRVVGLTVEPGQLIRYRKWRQARLGAGSLARYVDAESIYEEVEAARLFCRRAGFAIIDVTDKPIESSAEEVIAHVTCRLNTELPTG